MPNPNPDETRQEFLHRCMSNSEAINSFPKEDQRIAFCESQYNRRNKKSYEREYKDFDATIKDVDVQGRVLVAANAIGNIDAVKDISMPGSFQKTLSENFSRLKWFLNHNSDFLIGVPIEGKEKSSQLELLGQINMKKQLGRDVYEDYRLYAEYGKTLEHSVGVEALKKEQKEDVREVYEWKLWEYSTLYGWGANPKTPLISMKSIDEYTVKDQIDWLEIKLKKGNFSDEKFLDIEKQLKNLRSLCLEPDNSTYELKPNEDLIEPASTTLSLPETVECPKCKRHTYNTQKSLGYIKCHRLECEAIFTYGSKFFVTL